jgi:glycosyltransferase involved in cell wall biosynthesis
LKKADITIISFIKQMKNRLLFVYKEPSTFVKTDRKILSEQYEVTDYCFRPVRGLWRTAIEMVRQFFFLLFNARKFEKTYVWFADYHSLLPVLFARLLRRQSYLVIGGYDICRERSLSYGAFCSRFRGFFSAQSIRNATVNLSVSQYVDRKIGFVFPKTNHTLIYNCIDLSVDDILPEKEKLVLCVALIESQRTFLRKGIDTFLELAVTLPDYRLVLIGPNQSALALFPKQLPANVTVFERLPHQALKDYFEKASFYCQLSRAEIFGIAIGEAMLYKAIPLVTNVGGMPEVIGETGVIVPRNAQQIAGEIRRMEGIDTSVQRKACMERIEKMFGYETRKNKLLDLVNNFSFSTSRHKQ